jgi:hypothetical protein
MFFDLLKTLSAFKRLELSELLESLLLLEDITEQDLVEFVMECREDFVSSLQRFVFVSIREVKTAKFLYTKLDNKHNRMFHMLPSFSIILLCNHGNAMFVPKIFFNPNLSYSY